MIENRDLTRCELTYILEGQIELRKDPIYLDLLKKRREIENLLAELIGAMNKEFEHSNMSELVHTLSQMRKLDNDLGFWDGEMFAKIRDLRSKEY